MANPAIVECPANQWTKVATNVTAGTIHKLLKDPNVYLQTYRETGDPAPIITEDAVPIFLTKLYESVSSSFAIDVYIYARNVDGRVRVDI